MDIVGLDPNERRERKALNLGHTLAHALETSGSGRLRHGEAVAIGLGAALRLGREDAEEQIGLLRRWGLPTELPAWADRAELAALMLADKKGEDGALAIVVPGAEGSCSLWRNVTAELLLGAG
jgi:3-dehydroquinate synthetase